LQVRQLGKEKKEKKRKKKTPNHQWVHPSFKYNTPYKATQLGGRFQATYFASNKKKGYLGKVIMICLGL
jgi:hypothetical protein